MSLKKKQNSFHVPAAHYIFKLIIYMMIVIKNDHNKNKRRKGLSVSYEICMMMMDNVRYMMNNFQKK